MREAHPKVGVNLDWGHWSIWISARRGWVGGGSIAQWFDHGPAVPRINQSAPQHSKFTTATHEIAAHVPDHISKYIWVYKAF